MSSKRKIRRDSCDGKIRHSDKDAALTQIKDLLAHRRVQGWIEPYKCAFCNGYHVGHRKKR